MHVRRAGAGATDGLYLGLDIGSSSTKGILADRDGELVAAAEFEHGISRPRPGWAEHDAERDWWESAADVCRRLLEGRSRRVEAVGVDGLGPCLLVAGEDGRPLRPRSSTGSTRGRAIRWSG